MALQSLTLFEYSLPLRKVWRSRQGRIAYREGLIIRARDTQGLQGFGDCAPLPMAGTETRTAAQQWLEDTIPAFRGLSTDDAIQALDEFSPRDTPAARCGLETALLDLHSRQRELPLFRYLHPQARASLELNSSLGVLDRDAGSRLDAAAGFRVLKIKLGLQSVEEDIAALRQLTGQLPPGTQLRLDANGAWDAAAARRFITGLAGLPVEALEDPLADPSLVDLAALQARAPFPLALDHALCRLDHQALLHARPVQRLVLKPMVLGGLRPALRLAQQAQQAGLDCVVTSSVDSAIGVLAASHLAAAVNATQTPLAHGLATGAWLDRDVCPALNIHAGRLRLASHGGLGLQPRIDHNALITLPV